MDKVTKELYDRLNAWRQLMIGMGYTIEQVDSALAAMINEERSNGLQQDLP